MERCKIKFNSYILGLVCILIVCILPAISPVVFFVTKTGALMPHLLIFVAIAGVLYEFHIPDNEVAKILKIEHIIVYIASFVFLGADVLILIVRATVNDYGHQWFDYCLMGYVLVPTIVAVIETCRSIKEYIDSDETNNDGNKIVVGNTPNV